MSVVELEISKNWFSNTTVLPTNWDRIRDPLIIFGSNTNRNLEQFAKDAFGLTYSIDNDGNANLSTDLQTQILNISLGATPFQAAVDGDYYAIQCNNTQANGAGSTNETVNLRFGFGTDGSVGRFGFGKEQDYTSAANSDSFFFIQTDLNGALGERFRITSGGNVGINATTRFYLDGSACTGNTYIYESAADNIIMVAGATPAFQVANGTVSVLTGNNFTIPSTYAIYLDGGVNTYIYESAADNIIMVAGATPAFQVANGTVSVLTGNSLTVAATSRLYLDGGSDTYIYESIANRIAFYASGEPVAYMYNDTGLASGAKMLLPATGMDSNKLYLDGISDTYIYESVANTVDYVLSNVLVQKMYSGGTEATSYVAVSPTSKLYLDGGSDTYIYESSANVLDFVIGGTGYLRLNTASGATFLNAGTANSTNAQMDAAGVLTHPVSSIKYKKDIVDLEIDSSKIYNLRPVSFTYKADDLRAFGLIAEEVEKQIPLLNYHNPDGTPETVHYDYLSVLLLQEIKKLNERIKILESK